MSNEDVFQDEAQGSSNERSQDEQSGGGESRKLP